MPPEYYFSFHFFYMKRKCNVEIFLQIQRMLRLQDKTFEPYEKKMNWIVTILFLLA